MIIFGKLCEAFSNDPDFVVFMGPEELIPEAVAAGADGGVCGGGNLLPSVYVNLFNASVSDDAAEVARLRHVVDEVFRQIYRNPQGHMNLIPGLKLAMEQCGLCSRCIAPPLPAVSADHEQQILRGLEDVLQMAGSSLSTLPLT